MKLLYCKCERPNFGDDLNALLWPRLAPSLFCRNDGDGFLGIGTIIGQIGTDLDRLHVFSSGVGYVPVDTAAARRWRVWCVRGPLSARILGIDASLALTDGAVLTPAILAPPARRGGIVVVPHWHSLLPDTAACRWETACRLAGMTLVNPMQPPELVIPRIAGASLVLAESLHGAIAADTYGVPWIAFATSRNVNVFKWMDWALSVATQLRIHLVRPPEPTVLLRHGRPLLGRWGSCARPDEDAAMSDFAERSGTSVNTAARTPSSLRLAMKRQVAGSPRLQSLIGYSPPQTARELARLANAPTSLSSETIRRRHADRMMSLLDALVRQQAAMQHA